jgi:hypothetical protein
MVFGCWICKHAWTRHAREVVVAVKEAAVDRYDWVEEERRTGAGARVVCSGTLLKALGYTRRGAVVGAGADGCATGCGWACGTGWL